MMGRNGVEAIAWLIKEVGISDQISVQDFVAQKDAMLAEMFPECNAFPGAERLVRHFAKHHIPMAICSGSCYRKFKQKSVKHRDWLDLIPIKFNLFHSTSIAVSLRYFHCNLAYLGYQVELYIEYCEHEI
ncbi:unnamed protein product [Strongylus vulgaris]|uniref:Uncharacterized protein n=1 Tax=Strongylus vulgaris TaxID=40348 RepID=A0A3P7J7F4_STRVU|nr:unnamed protein product [Strongylus vulgaris]